MKQFLMSYKDMMDELMNKKLGLSMKGKEKVHDYQGWGKLNTDASFWPDEGIVSTGIIIRDWQGRVLLTACRWLRNYATPEEAEAEACLQGIRLANEWIKKPTEVEMDCQWCDV
jgi:hypothetical protein